MRVKTKSIRFGDASKRYERGKILTLTCGWNEQEATELGKIKVLDVMVAPIRNLKDSDLVGESPDCLTVEAVPYVLSAIYRKVITKDDIVTLVRWDYID